MLCPHAEVYFKVDSEATSNWKMVMESLGEWYVDYDKMLTSLEQKVLKRFDNMQHLRRDSQVVNRNVVIKKNVTEEQNQSHNSKKTCRIS